MSFQTRSKTAWKKVPSLRVPSGRGTLRTLSGPGGGSGHSVFPAGPPSNLHPSLLAWGQPYCFRGRLRTRPPGFLPPACRFCPDTFRPAPYTPWPASVRDAHGKRRGRTHTTQESSPVGCRHRYSPPPPSAFCLFSKAFSLRCRSDNRVEICSPFCIQTNSSTPKARLQRVFRLVME